jgi:hypothetical protein
MLRRVSISVSVPALFTSLALTACGPATPGTKQPTPAAGARVSQEQATALCASTLADDRARLAKVRAAEIPMNIWPMPIAEAFASCVPAGNGAWALTIHEDLAITRDEAMSHADGTWSLVFLGADGTRTVACDAADAKNRSTGAPCGSLQIAVRWAFSPVALRASDLDDAGSFEAAIGVESCGDEGAGCDTRWSVHAVAGAKVVPYAPTERLRIAGVDDPDGDGRLDFVVHEPFVASWVDGVGNDHEITGPKLLVHALARGALSGTDGVAAAFAKKSCGAELGTIVVKAKGAPELDEEATGHAVACARLRGEPTKAILEKLAVACGKYAPRDVTTSAPPLANGGDSVCSDWLKAWAEATPPVTIAK